MPRPRKLTISEHTAILIGLRNLQETLQERGNILPPHFNHHMNEPGVQQLTLSELDTLAEEINCGEVRL